MSKELAQISRYVQEAILEIEFHLNFFQTFGDFLAISDLSRYQDNKALLSSPVLVGCIACALNLQSQEVFAYLQCRVTEFTYRKIISEPELPRAKVFL